MPGAMLFAIPLSSKSSLTLCRFSLHDYSAYSHHYCCHYLHLLFAALVARARNHGFATVGLVLACGFTRTSRLSDNRVGDRYLYNVLL